MNKSTPEDELLQVKAANRALKKQLARMRASREEWISGIEMALAEASGLVGDSVANPKSVARVIRSILWMAKEE